RVTLVIRHALRSALADAGAATHYGIVIYRVSMVLVGAATVAALVSSVRATLETKMASESEIRELLMDHVDTQRKSVGTIVGLLTPRGRRFVSYGHSRRGDPRPLDADTVFEVGSVTKLFTALLLADMVQRGEVALDAPLSQYLPDVKVPE